MKLPHWSSFLKALLFCFWIGSILALLIFFFTHPASPRTFLHLLRQEVLEAGAWGPFLLILLYIASTILMFAKGTLDVIAGIIYGPVWGTLIVLVGLNLAAMLAFLFGRFFGRSLVEKYERGWVKKYNRLLAEEGFMTVLLMRLLSFPFDVVSLGCGMSRMAFRPYAFATFFGSIPLTVAWVALGGSFTHPRTWIIFVLVAVGSILLALGLRRLPWVQKALYNKEPPAGNS